MKKKAVWFVLCGALLLAAGGCQQKSEQHTGNTPDPSAEAEAAVSYVAENEKYGLSLPEAEIFGQELKDFIYWEYATMIEKDVHGLMSVLTNLEEEGCLDKELKLHLYYYECDVSKMDGWNCNYYDVVVTFPEEEQVSYFSFSYNAKGFSRDYDYGYGGWFSKDIEDDMPSQKLVQKKWFQKQYTFFGETSLTLSREEAERYEVTDRFEAGKKEQILSAIKKQIKKEYKKSKNTIVYVRDFLPGDFSLSGEEVDLHMTSKWSIPLYWIRSQLIYSDKKMETFEDVYWDTHYSSAYSAGGHPNYNPTVKRLKKWAKEEKEAVNIDKCILAYQIKNGKMIDLKGEERDAGSDMAAKMNLVSSQNGTISIDVLHAEKKTAERKKRKEINVGPDEEYVQQNNNRINGRFIVPYQEGYFYSMETSPETDPVYVYDDGKGNVTKQKGVLWAEYILDDYIYYYDNKANAIMRSKERQIESIIKFQYSGWYPVFYAEDGIYYTDIDEDGKKAYIGKAAYDGTQNQKLYELNVNLEQIYQYRNELWFIYSDFEDVDQNGLGKIDLTDHNVTVYRGIHPTGHSSAGCQLSFNNGYVYFNSSGLNRLNVQNDTIEQVFRKKADAVNFVGNSILFCRDKVLYKMDSDGVGQMKKVKGKTAGIDGIRVDGKKIYIEIFGGAFYYEICQIDARGRTIKNILN